MCEGEKKGEYFRKMQQEMLWENVNVLAYTVLFKYINT